MPVQFRRKSLKYFVHFQRRWVWVLLDYGRNHPNNTPLSVPCVVSWEQWLRRCGRWLRALSPHQKRGIYLLKPVRLAEGKKNWDVAVGSPHIHDSVVVFSTSLTLDSINRITEGKIFHFRERNMAIVSWPAAVCVEPQIFCLQDSANDMHPIDFTTCREFCPSRSSSKTLCEETARTETRSCS